MRDNLSREPKRLLVAALCFAPLFCCVVPNGRTKAQTARPNSQSAIQSRVNVVLVPVVVRDAQGHAVETLKNDDFRVFDDGKERTITGFSIETSAAGTAINGSSVASSPAIPGSSGAAPPPNSLPQRFVVLMFDDMHMGPGSLEHAQDAAAKMLRAQPGGAEMFAVLTTSGSNSGLTRDRKVLEGAIQRLRSRALSPREIGDCPSVDYYEADRILNENDRSALAAATQDAMVCADLSQAMQAHAAQMAIAAAQRAFAAGNQGIRLTLNFLMRVVRGMDGLPGQRVLVLISAGFPILTESARGAMSELVDAAAGADVTIDGLDARGLYAPVIDASQRGTALASAPEIQLRQAGMLASEDVMSELADGTGGAFFHNNNDLESGLTGPLSNGGCVYLLQFSLNDVKRDGAFHRLTVKVDQPRLAVRARRGYFAPAANR